MLDNSQVGGGFLPSKQTKTGWLLVAKESIDPILYYGKNDCWFPSLFTTSIPLNTSNIKALVPNIGPKWVADLASLSLVWTYKMCSLYGKINRLNMPFACSWQNLNVKGYASLLEVETCEIECLEGY